MTKFKIKIEMVIYILQDNILEMKIMEMFVIGYFCTWMKTYFYTKIACHKNDVD